MKLIDEVLYREIKSSALYLTILVVLSFSLVGLDALAPWPFKVLIDNVIGTNPPPLRLGIPTLSFILQSRQLLGFLIIFVYFLITFSINIVEYGHSVIMKKFIRRLTSGFSKEAFANLQLLAIGFYRKQEIGDYIYRLSYDVAALGTFFEDGILPLITSTLYLVVTIGVMFFISSRLTLLSLLILPFLSIGIYVFGKNVALATKKSEHWSSAIFSFIEEALAHLKIVQAFSQERRVSKKFGEKLDASLRSDVTLYRTNFLLSLLVGIIIGLSYAMIIAYGIQSVFAKELTTGLLIVFIFYLDNLTSPLISFIYAVSSLKESYVKISRMRDFFDPKTYRISSGTIREIKDTGIEFSKVSVQADGGGYLLKNISFKIPANSRTVILGENGSGKTTILSLLMRFIDKPTHGNVSIGGVNLLDYEVANLRANVTFVPQEIMLFDDSIAQNITFGSLGSSLEEIKEAAKLAGAHDFITKLPGEYDFRVGEGGNYLSGGQRQKIMIARAFVRRQAKILLFDEIFSALDLKARIEMLQQLNKFSEGKTMMLVSNIVSVAQSADYVLVLSGGQLAYFGKASHFSTQKDIRKLLLEIA